MLSKVVSGGQSGVDAAALRAARTVGIPTGGYAPRGWLTEDGPNPGLADYGLIEHTSLGYPPRTRANVQESDGTLIVARTRPLDGGTKLTAGIAAGLWKPWMAVYLDEPGTAGWVRTVAAWVRASNVRVLNVAGPRESKNPGLGAAAEAFLVDLFRELKGGA